MLNKFRWPYREDKIFSILSFIVVAVPVIFSLFTNENFETIKLSIWLVCAGWALLLLAHKLWQKGSLKSLQTDSLFLSLFFVGLLLFGLISAIFAPDKWYSFFGFYYRFTNSWLFILLWVLTFILALNVLNKPKWDFLIKLLVFDALLVAVKGILEAMDIGLYQGDRISAFFHSPSLLGNPNFSSLFMACLLPFVFVLWKHSKRFWQQIYYAVTFFILSVCLLVLASRGALLALIAGAIFFVGAVFWLKIKSLPFKRFLLLILAGIILFMAILQISRPSILKLDFSDVNVRYRLQVWHQSWQAALSHPLAGVGLGNFALFHESAPRAADMGVFDDPHNLFLFLLSTGGIPFFFCFLLILFFPAWAAFKRLRTSGDILLLATLSSLVIFIVGSLFTPVPVPCYLLLLVLLSGLVVYSENSFSVNVPGGGIFFFLAGLVFIICGLSLFSGEVLFNYGYQKYADGEYQSANQWLHLSETINPTNKLSTIYAIQNDVRLKKNPEIIEREIQSLMSFHPHQAGIHIAASDVYYALYRSLNKSEYLNLAIADLNRALAIDPYFPERYEKLGYYYYLGQNFNKGLQYLEKGLAMKSDTTSISAYILEAKIYQQLQNREMMLAALGKAFVLAPENPKLRYLYYFAKTQTDINKIPLDIVINTNG